VYTIIEKGSFSTGKNAAIIRIVAPVQSGRKKIGKSPQNSGEKKKALRAVW